MKKVVVLAIAILAFGADWAPAGISSSKHDFSSTGWNPTNEICVVCHTPHQGDQTFDYGPLWNHENTTATYTLYTSSTLDATMEQPGGVSKLCLSCHDGTVALDNFGGATGGSQYMPGTPGVPGSPNLGLDLSDDHPVGFRWEHQTIKYCTLSCHFGGGGDPYSYEVRFYNHRVECSTCHDPHNNGSGVPMLRMSMVGSELCLLCHNDKGPPP